jgi:hypothetical protein
MVQAAVAGARAYPAPVLDPPLHLGFSFDLMVRGA